VPMPIPPKQEQTAIANVLSDSDALIGALEQLIAKKQAIKSATMQQLLTGRTRLPAFALRPDGTPKGYKPSELGDIPEDWCAATIHDITDNIIDYRGRTPKKLGMEWGGGNIPALSAGNVKKGFIDYQAECYFGSDELYRKWMTSGHAKRDDIVFTMEAPLGNAALIPDDQMYILSQRTVLLQIARSKYNPTFIIHYFLSDSFQRYISDSATGSTAQGIKRTTFEKMYVAVPICIEEQTAIATILSDMDNELQALTQKLKKARALKQGMMQQLLTGKIRLIKPLKEVIHE
jgi:type I restriction enzyme, S subunit